MEHRICGQVDCPACARVRHQRATRRRAWTTRNPEAAAQHWAKRRGVPLQDIAWDRWSRIPEAVRSAWYARGLELPMTPKQMTLTETAVSMAAEAEVVNAIKDAPRWGGSFAIVAAVLAVIRRVKAVLADQQRRREQPKPWELDVPVKRQPMRSIADLMNSPDLMKLLGRTS